MRFDSNRRPDVSVVIPAYGRPQMLRNTLRSLLHQTLEPERFEVVVVDSTYDESNVAVVNEVAREARFPLTCLRKKPEGPGPSRNLGVESTTGPVIAFLDSDCMATSGWLEAGLAAFSEGIGIVQGKTLPDPGVRAGVFSFYVKVEAESHFYETANIFYRREAFEESGRFPSDLTPNADTPIGGEDVEVAWAVKRKGWESRFTDAALVYHEVRPISVWQWICISRLFRVPGLVARFPELRPFMFARIFYDRVQCLFCIAVFGTALTALNPAGLVLLLPYVFHRLLEPSNTLRGVLRIIRVAAYVLRDTSSFFLLLSGSVRYRAIVL